MSDVMKDVLMNLLFGDSFPASCRVQSEDPDFLDVNNEIELLIKQMKEKFTEEEYNLIVDTLALSELANGYQILECFHSGLTTGFELRDTIRGDKREKAVINLIH